MADQQDRGGQKQGMNDSDNPEQHRGVRTEAGTNDNAETRTDRDTDRDRQNRDDPSRAPESGDRK